MLREEVFKPGEVLDGLHCFLGKPLRAEDLVPYLGGLGLTPIWNMLYPTDDPSNMREEQVDDVPEGEILTGYALDGSTVELWVVPDGVTLPHEKPAHLFADVPCTNEQATAWR